MYKNTASLEAELSQSRGFRENLDLQEWFPALGIVKLALNGKKRRPGLDNYLRVLVSEGEIYKSFRVLGSYVLIHSVGIVGPMVSGIYNM